jgi:hypothetical protein
MQNTSNITIYKDPNGKTKIGSSPFPVGLIQLPHEYRNKPNRNNHTTLQ